MTSLFSVIAHEDANDQSKLRQAMALAHQRVDDRFGAFVRKGSIEDQGARYSLVEEDIRAVVAAACAQVGFADVDGVLRSIGKNFISEPEARKVASTVHESRKPKMCPYHSEVTDISLAAGDPQAGFNAMAQHAWSGKHCQGEEYKGDKCKFKPAMTTQSYWDERAETLEQRRQDRAEREEQQRLEQEQINELPEVETPQVEPVEPVGELEGGDLATTSEPVADPPAEVPMSMAAKTASPTTGLAGPEPKMDKRKWTPKTVPELDADDEDGRYPTRRKDVTQPIRLDQGDRFNPSELKEIGEQVTEHQDVTQKGGPAKTDQGGTFSGGERSAVSSLLDNDSVKHALAKFKRD
jgi:hypothetical protein